MTRVDALLVGACARLDRFVLERFIRRRPPAPLPGLAARLRRAAAFYADDRFVAEPDAFFAPPAALDVRARFLLPLPGGDLRLLRYESAFTPVFPDARTDPFDAGTRQGLALWWRHDAAGHPAMLCVHGYGGGRLWLESLAFEAVRFYRAGVDVVVYVLPYHGARTPPGARHSGEPFFDLDLVRTNEAFARAVYELRALHRHLLAAGTGPVGAFGMSLGAYTVALLASVERDLAFAVPMIPLVSFVDRWWSEGERDPWLAVALAHGWSRDLVTRVFRVHEPLTRAPLVPHAARLVIGALGDGICTPAHADALWRHWGCPRIHWYAGGHLAQLGRTAALRDVRALIRDAGLLGPPVPTPRPTVLVARAASAPAAIRRAEGAAVRARAPRRRPRPRPARTTRRRR